MDADWPAGGVVVALAGRSDPANHGILLKDA
jgi:hypothetical protein